MKINLACLGRFHVFELASQMDRLGHLGKLYTGVPKSRIKELSLDKVKTFPWLTVPTYIAGRLGYRKLQNTLNIQSIRLFDQWLSRQVESSDIFYSLSGFSTLAYQIIKNKYCPLTICDRGSTHIQFQDRILAEEYERWGLPYEKIDSWVIERELLEYDLCDLLTVPSEFVRRTFIQQGIPAEKIAKIPYGVDLRMFRPVRKQDNKFRVVYVGALSIRKGLPYLLQAVSQLKLTDFELVLIGGLSDDARPFLEKYAGQYRHIGIVSRAELFQYYSQGSIFVLASIEEGLALVQAQAMACGLPIIATYNTGAEDLFTNGKEGFIVPARDSEAIKEKIIYLYENPEVREHLGQAALRRVQSLGGWNSYGDLAAQTYQVALDKFRNK